MTVYETDLPNVGRRFDLELEDGGTLSVVIQYNGRRVVYQRPPDAADAHEVAELPPEDARQLGAILAGAYFEGEPASASVPVGENRIEWTTVSGGVGDTIADATDDLDLSVLALQRDADTRGNPDPETTLESGDVLVTLGSQEAHDRFRERLAD